MNYGAADSGEIGALIETNNSDGLHSINSSVVNCRMAGPGDNQADSARKQSCMLTLSLGLLCPDSVASLFTEIWAFL